LVEWLAAGVSQTSGVALASGKVRFYQPGTLTPQSVYSDSACTSAISQPVTLSAGGTSVVYTNASVRMIVKDAIDTNTLFDVVENVQRDDNTFVTSPSFNSGNEVALSTILDAWATTGGGGGTVNWGYKQSGTATERALKSWMAEVHVSVKDFGAVGDGANNDTALIQAAITAVGAAGGGIVYFPPGTYLINAALTMGTSGVSLCGAGPSTSIIKNSGGAVNAITATSCNGFYVKDLSISHATSSTASAIQLASCGTSTAGVLVDNVSLAGHRTCLSLTGATTSLIVTRSYLTCPNTNAAERGIAHGSTGSVAAFLNTGSGQGIDVELTSSGSISLDNNTLSSATGSFKFNASYTGPGSSASNTIVNNTMFSALSYGGLATEPANTIVIDNQGSFFNPTTNLFSGNTLTPDRGNGSFQRYALQSTGVAYTINVPTPSPSTLVKPRNLLFTLVISNQAGGPVTAGSGLAAGYHTSAAVSLVDGQQTSYIFRWDPESNVWRELSRSVTT
jgi:hypothetical protein